MLALILALGSVAAGADELDDKLALARELSYGESWSQARPLLEEIEAQVSPERIGSYAEYQLLRARHETLSGDGEAAIARMERLLEHPLAANQQIEALHQIAHSAVLLRDYERGFDGLTRALALDPEAINNQHRIPILNMAAYMFGRVGETERALQHGRRAIELARAEGDLRAECISRQRVAPVLKWDQRAAEAERAYRLGIEQCARIGNALFVGVLEHGLADLLRNQGQTDEAFELASRAIEALDEGVFPLGEFEARLVHAETLFDRSPDTIAAPPWPQRLESLEAFMREHRSWDQLARLEALRARIALHRGQPHAAANHLERQLEAREQFLGHERQMRLAYLEVQFDTRLKEQEIELLHERARAAEIESLAGRQQQQLRNLVLVLAGLLVVLLVVVLGRTRRAHRHFRHLSRHDGLTGLANHSWFFDHGKALLSQTPEPGRHRYLLMADIDHFKQINDTHGHPVGDQVLRALAEKLRGQFADDALIGRIGGEEFGVLTEAPSAESMLERIERLKAELRANRRHSDGPTISLSLGLVQIARDESLTDAMRRVDQLLYQAKSAGRDRLVTDPNIQPHPDPSPRP
ncbi:MAG: GGDEF domain-containing protein [Wenzhouxiangellaceae bacterium]|nr:GGDEF domain-containing protein [Wenzhouxiangellaceae bacterium]